MKSTQPSLTAYRAAFARAAHQLLDTPRLIDDPIAIKIIGGPDAAEICAHPERYRNTHSTSLRAFLVARSKYAEQALAEAVGRGVRQYVILGAGLDTFAYRNPYSAQDLVVFEIDHHATQDWKKDRLRSVGIPRPALLKFVALDFETDKLEEQLPQVGFKTTEPAFFSWLGVSMYLPGPTVLATLKSVASLAFPGSGIVFDYQLSPEMLSPRQLLSYEQRAERVAGLGESWKSTFDPGRLHATLKTLGFSVEEDLAPQAINERFFKDRPDPLSVHGSAHLLKAKIKADEK
jgi:methyltransferase (TIGR00027 family)